MSIRYPYPRRSKYSFDYQKLGEVDWDLSAPIGRDTDLLLPFPCRGTNNGPVQATYKAGEQLDVQFINQTYHRGGHCQFSISYDDGKTFGVLLTIIRTCFLETLNFKIDLPTFLPTSNKVILSWTWVNASGLREYYMNCVDIAIINPNKVYQKVVLPQMLVVNLPGYPTIPEFYASKEDGRELYFKQPNVTVI